LSFLTRFRRPPTAAPAEEPTPLDAPRRRWWRHPVVGGAVSVLAGLLVLFALVGPNELARLTPAAFVRIPVEGVILLAVLLLLPAAPRRVAAVLVGVLLGVMAILKALDMGFSATLARPFNPVFDWTFFGPAVEFVKQSFGRAGAIGAAIVVVALVAGVLVLMTLSVLRLTNLAVRHRTAAIRTGRVLAVAWGLCAVIGAQFVPGMPVASRSAADLVYYRSAQIGKDLHDEETFAAEAAVDAFRDTPGKDLLTGLRGKDVLLSFIESYGRDAVEDPEFATQVGAVLDAGTTRLRAAGYSARSGFLTSPTAGGGSWLAHATLLSGLWIDNPQRYRTLMASDRLTLNGAFHRASWRTVGLMPAVTHVWPEASFYGYDRVYDFKGLGYRGPKFTFASPPDQYTLATFQRSERATPGHAPVMAETALLSSHTPWAPIPKLIDWNDVGDGSVFAPIAAAGEKADVVWRDTTRVRTEYRRSIEYTLNTLISYVETYGDDNLVLVFLGDHQPAPIITGDGASHDVPITIVARDPAVLDRISGWGWQDGLKPGPQAPVWRMNTFRDRFLTAFGSQPAAMRAAAPVGR
jgi:hypothetical protein